MEIDYQKLVVNRKISKILLKDCPQAMLETFSVSGEDSQALRLKQVS